MIILIDKNYLITSFATAGGFEGGIEVPNSVFPDTFVAEFKSGKFKYFDGVVSYNKEYKDEENQQLKSDNVSLEEKVRLLEQRIKDLENLQTPS